VGCCAFGSATGLGARGRRGYRTFSGGNSLKPSNEITNEGGRGMYIGGGLLAIILIIIILILIF
jgi:hypothetical protein